MQDILRIGRLNVFQFLCFLFLSDKTEMDKKTPTFLFLYFMFL